MDSHQPPRKPAHLLDDLESIRRVLGQQDQEPPLLTESLDAQDIPLLSEIVEEEAEPVPVPLLQPPQAPVTPIPPVVPLAQPNLAQPHTPQQAEIAQGLRRALSPGAAELARLDGELRSAAQLLLQDVIDDFVPQIEAELRRRLDARLDRLLAQRKR
jgi:hypothetical protein